MVLEVVDADGGYAARPVGVLGEVGLVGDVGVVLAGDGEERRRLVRPVLGHHRRVLALQLDRLPCLTVGVYSLKIAMLSVANQSLLAVLPSHYLQAPNSGPES